VNPFEFLDELFIAKISVLGLSLDEDLWGTLNLREWTMQEWTIRHHVARVDFAGVDKSARCGKGGHCRSGQCGTMWQGWTMQEWTYRHVVARGDNAGVDNAGVLKQDKLKCDINSR